MSITCGTLLNAERLMMNVMCHIAVPMSEIVEEYEKEEEKEEDEAEERKKPAVA